MECRTVRELAHEYVSAKAGDQTALSIAAHLDHCRACRAEVEGVRRLRASVRSAYLAANELAPGAEFAVEMRSRLRSAALRDERVPSWRRSWLALAASAVLMLGGGLGLHGLGLWGFTAILHAAVGDHRFCLVSFKLAERPIPLEQASQLYDDPVDLKLDSVQPSSPELRGGPIRIVERHSCVYAGRRFAHIVLRYKRERISMVVTPDERLFRSVPGASMPGDGSIVSLPPTEGFQVAGFRGPRHVVFFVSALGEDDLREVAGSMEAAVSRALKGI